MQVPRGHVWLQGDNTLNSTDSRDYGPLPYNMMLGRVICRVRLPDTRALFGCVAVRLPVSKPGVLLR